jgi:uncharacterized protein (DUF1501 family)
MTKINNAARREFLRRAGAVSATGAAAPMALNLSAIGSAAAAQADDYKALVCVYLFGANDHYNTYVPYDVSSHQQYSQLRQTLATDRSALTATQLNPQTALANGKRFALAPQLSDLHDVWNEGNLAVVLNTGTLMAPTTKAQYRAKSVPLPPKLFSHNDQTSFWQSLAAEGATTGWGGQMGDLFLSDNTHNQFTSVSVTGNAVLLSGNEAVQYQVTPNGSVSLNANRYGIYGSNAVSQAMLDLMPRPSAHLIQNVYGGTTKRSLEANELLTSALAGTSDLSTPFATDRLSSQLRMVARMIAARSQLGVKRQVFFVGVGTFDHHDGLVTRHPEMLTQVNAAMNSFYRATEELNIQNNVTAFTASEFGRTITSNGDGSDHGWGSHHMVMGGAVNGREFYGQAPELGNNGPDDVGNGRLLPTTSVDQYAATLGSWFGVNNTELNTIFPRLSEFDGRPDFI